MVRISQFFKSYRLALFSGLLIGTSYIPCPPWALLFCYVPLWLDVSQNSLSLKDILKRGWVTQFVLTLIGFHWIAYTAKEFGFMPWPLAILVLLLFAAGVHLYIPLSLAAVQLLTKRFRLTRNLGFVLFALLLGLSENLWPSLFPWNLGYPWLWIHSPVAQTADIWGFESLSLFVYLSNAVVAILWLGNWPQRIKGLIALSVFWMGLHFLGQYRVQPWQNTVERLRVLLIQANIGNFEKYAAEKGIGFQQEIADKYFSLTREAFQKSGPVDMIVWPESAYPDFLNDFAVHRRYTSQLIALIQELKTPLMTGGYSADPPGTHPQETYNGLFLFDENARLLAPPYHKTMLLAFGEYVPMGNWFPVLKQWNPGGPGFGRGSGPVVFPFKNLKLGLQICYESLHPPFTSSLVDEGTEILFNLTNDSWFGAGFEPKQHMTMTVARAIEARRPLVRSTNTGISTVAQATGEIMEQSPLDSTWAGVYEVKYQKNPDKTIFSQYGFLYEWLVLAAIFIFIFLGKGRRQEGL